MGEFTQPRNRVFDAVLGCTGLYRAAWMDPVGNNTTVLFPTGPGEGPVNYFLPDPVGNKIPQSQDRTINANQPQIA